MDPITHAIVGAGIYALSGGDVSLAQPALLGCVAGSLMPDLDIIAKVRNDYYYLKHHRGGSHSFAGVLLQSLFIAVCIGFLYRDGNFPAVFTWTFVGGMAHVFFDILNSYGAQILWPFSRKKFSLSLLGIFDIIVVILAIAALLSGKGVFWAKAAVAAAFGMYIFILGIMRELARRRVSSFFKGRVEPNSIKVLPSLSGFLVWGFIIISRRHSIVGRVHLLRNKVMISATLKRLRDEEKEKFANNRAAFFFREFTPLYHVGVRRNNDFTEVVYTDLRYRIKNDFKHHATAVFNSRGTLVECVFHPFCKNRRISF